MFKIGFLLSMGLVVLISGCAADFTKATLFDESIIYPQTQTVEILSAPPDKPYKKIALLEAQRGIYATLPDLLNSMRQKAKQIGADAIIPYEYTDKPVSPGLMYNPWLGGYQILPGGNVPVLRGYAIKYQ